MRQTSRGRTRSSGCIVDSSGDAIIGKTPEGIITSWNSGAASIYGYRAAEVVGKSISLLAMPGSIDDIPHILQATQERESRSSSSETIRRRKDETPVRVSLRISSDKGCRTGKIVGAATIARDMTEHKQLQEEIEILNTDLSARAAKLELPMLNSGPSTIPFRTTCANL